MANFEEATKVVLDPTAALDARIRALYVLKERRDRASVEVLLQAVDTTTSVLLQHEFLYNVGQFGFPEASLATLERIVADAQRYNEVSRHEAIEAMGALAQASSLPFLRRYAANAAESAPIRESCELAVRRVETLLAEGASAVAIPDGCAFRSVDPSPAFGAEVDVAEATRVLMAPQAAASLWDKYRAMFSLRNDGSAEAVAALCVALRLPKDASSCLFRHEVAFVLGQLEHPDSSVALGETVADVDEHPMVRHEAAEALGAVAAERDWGLLKKYAEDPNDLVRDSCVVALEMHAYWSNWKPKTESAESA